MTEIKFNSMGCPLEYATTVFPRSFRWTIQPKSNPNLYQLFQSVKFNYFKNKFVVTIMDVCQDSKFPASDWISYLQKEGFEDFVFDAFDGLGTILFTLEIQQAKAMTHSLTCDYSSSDVMTHTIAFKYKKLIRTESAHESKDVLGTPRQNSLDPKTTQPVDQQVVS